MVNWRSHCAQTRRPHAGPRPGPLHLPAIAVHTPAVARAAVALDGRVVSMIVTLGDEEPRRPGPLGVHRPKDVLPLTLASGFLHFSRHAMEAVSLVTRFALAREGPWRVVAESIGVASAWLAFIHISAGSAIPGEAWEAGAGVGGAAGVDALGPLGDVTVMETSLAVVDGALVRGSHTRSCL